jgi:hypothetical protein
MLPTIFVSLQVPLQGTVCPELFQLSKTEVVIYDTMQCALRQEIIRITQSYNFLKVQK